MVPSGVTFYIDPYREDFIKFFLSKTKRSKPLIFGKKLCLVNLCQIKFSNKSPWAKNGLDLGHKGPGFEP